MSEPSKMLTLTDQVYQRLKLQLRNKELKIGDLLNARTIANELNVSRTTVNKAIDLLVQDNLVKRNSSQPAVVVARPRKLKAVLTDEYDIVNQTDKAYEQLLGQVLRGDFNPGEILKERRLAKKMALNVATLRRAAEWLCKDGLLERLPRRGWRVTMLTLQDMKDAYDLRLNLEPKAAAKAVHKISEDALAKLVESNNKLKHMGEEVKPYHHREADYNFHLTICRSSGNRMLSELLDPLVRRVMLIATAVGFNIIHTPESYDEHAHILEAMRARDEKATASRMRAHIRHSRRIYLAVMKNL